MLIYLDHAFVEARAECAAEHRLFTRSELHAAIMRGAVERVRPKMMIIVAIMAGLLPILWSTCTGSEVMQRIAVPINPVESRRDSFDLCDRERDRDITAARHAY
jgi:copper/silver efflux system protein